MTRTYTTRTDAIAREIIDPLSASEFPLTDWDIDAIADEVLGGHGCKYTLLRVLEASTTSPSGTLYSPVKYTMAFPLASFNRVHSVAGWTFSDKYKVLESFDVGGDTYLIALILP